MIAAAAAAALVLTQPWGIKTALYPRTIAVPLLVLALTEFVFSLRTRPAAGAEAAMDFKFSEDVDPKVALRRTLEIAAWILGFFAGIVLLGFPLAVPLFVFAYLRGAARAGWVQTVVLVAVAWAVFTGLFVRLLHLPFPTGVLLRMLQ
jgi:hypothetical protein